MRQKDEPNQWAAPAADEQEASQGFLSYAHADDDALGGVITRLHQELERKVRAVMGKSFPIFLDHDGIEFGQHWPDRLDEALATARFLIPILTPSYFTSDFCRQEAETFLEYETEAGRKDLVLPIYLIEADVLDNRQQRDADPLAKRLGERQYADWRHLAVLPADDPQLSAEVMKLARAIKKAAQRQDRPRKTPPQQIKKPVPEDLLPKLESNDPIDRLGAWFALSERAAGDPALSATLIEAIETRRDDEYDARVLKLINQITATNGGAPSAHEEEDTPPAHPSAIRFVPMVAVALLCLAAGAGIAWWVLPSNEQASATGDRIDALESAKETEDQLNASKEQFAELQKTIAEQSREIEELKSGAASSSAQLATIDDLESRIDGLKQELDGAKSERETTAAQLVEARAEAERLQNELAKRKSVTSPEPVETFRDCGECPEMVVMPAGTFQMGSPANEAGRRDNEGPQREVTIPAFVMGKYEVTFAEWDACVVAGGCSHKPEDRWGRGRQPVMRVSWKDAQEYVEWLSGRTGESYRLPSEAEWEYAARAGTTTAYAFGDEITSEQANFGGNEGKTTEVGSYAAMGSARYARQCVGVGGGLLERGLRRRAHRRHFLAARQL